MSRRTAVILCLVAFAVATAPPCSADGHPPDIYVLVGPEFDLEEDATEFDFGVQLGGGRRWGPDIGLYDGRVLLGVQYQALGTVDRMTGIYGGPSLIYYRDHFGGALTVGAHLSREWVVQASYRATPDWDGTVAISLGWGFAWSALRAKAGVKVRVVETDESGEAKGVPGASVRLRRKADAVVIGEKVTNDRGQAAFSGLKGRTTYEILVTDAAGRQSGAEFSTNRRGGAQVQVIPM